MKKKNTKSLCRKNEKFVVETFLMIYTFVCQNE